MICACLTFFWILGPPKAGGDCRVALMKIVEVCRLAGRGRADAPEGPHHTDCHC